MIKAIHLTIRFGALTTVNDLCIAGSSRWKICTHSDIVRNMAKTDLMMSDKMMELVARRFRTLGEPYRLRLLQMLEGGEMKVGDLVAGLDGNQPNVSKHLQILHEAGLVSRRRAGITIFYAISDPMVIKLCNLVCRSEVERSKRDYEELNAYPVERRKR
jgi:DNA-binding transcriptional ArsR family regulator